MFCKYERFCETSLKVDQHLNFTRFVLKFGIDIFFFFTNL